MTDAPEETWLPHKGELPVGNYDMVRYVRGDIHEAAVAATPDLARTALALMAQLEDAKAAQALVVERAEAECRLIADRFRSKMKGTTLADASYRLAEAEAADKCTAAIRALAPASGVAALAELRAERDEAKRLMQARHREMLAADNLMRKHQRRAEKAEREVHSLTSMLAIRLDERDDALARLAAAEAQVGALTEASGNAAMYLESGFINCPSCGEEVPTKHTDAEHELRAAIASAQGGDK